MRTSFFKPNSEAAITRAVRHFLRLKRIFHFKHFGTLGSEPGVPDIVGVLPGGRALYLEIKTDKGKLSEKQKNFLFNAQTSGAVATVVRSVEDVEKVVNEAMRGTI